MEEINGNKWENPEELRLGSHLNSTHRNSTHLNSTDPARNNPELDVERLGDGGEECSKTMPVEHWNEEERPNNDIEKSQREEKHPAEVEMKKKKKIETRNKKLKLMASENPED